MPRSSYSSLADSLAGGAWTVETDQPLWGSGATIENTTVACLIDMMRSLRAIRRRLECSTTEQAALEVIRMGKIAQKAENAKKKRAKARRKKVKS